jgi:shikimate dehydrogenase
MQTFALIGHPLSHSFSQRYFTEKFRALGLAKTHQYVNFDIELIDHFEKKLEEYELIRGCNVTIPYKKAIIPYLDELDATAARIGAVNTIDFRNGRRIGFNTDYPGFRDDLLAQRRRRNITADLKGQSALILGTGGASLAVHFALGDLGMYPAYVSRTPGPGRITYSDLTPQLVREAAVIVNTTPLGMYPNVDGAPSLPYGALHEGQLCYDLVYNPAETKFMRMAGGAGAGAVNGMGMLIGQAEKAWKIWTAHSV